MGGKMSSAFPEASSTDIFGRGAAAIPVPERGVHIPAAYVRNPHHDPEHTVVKRGGVSILGADGEPFMVSQVAPERRWAIMEDGNVLDGEQFSAAKQAGVLEFYEMLKTQGHPDAKFEGKITNEAVPDVGYYVSWGVDPRDDEKLLEIGYDPNATDGAVVKNFHDQKGDEIMSSRIEVLSQAYANTVSRAQMTDSERAEVEQHLGVTVAVGTDGVAAKLEVLTDLHKSGSLSNDDYLDAVSKLTGAAPVAVEVAPSAAKQPTMALCGKADCKGEVGKKAHERRCEKCIALAAEETAD
jgi:hypothetical protein